MRGQQGATVKFARKVHNSYSSLRRLLLYFQCEMSEIGSFSDISEDQGLSEASSQFSLDVEDPNEERGRLGVAVGGVDFVGPYMDEPLADEEWLEGYYQERREEGERLEHLGRRLDGTEPVDSW